MLLKGLAAVVHHRLHRSTPADRGPTNSRSFLTGRKIHTAAVLIGRLRTRKFCHKRTSASPFPIIESGLTHRDISGGLTGLLKNRGEAPRAECTRLKHASRQNSLLRHPASLQSR